MLYQVGYRACLLHKKHTKGADYVMQMSKGIIIIIIIMHYGESVLRS